MRRFLVTALGLVLLIAGCGGDDDATRPGGARGKLSVVASFYPLAEAAARVGGEAVDVVNLTPAGTEPHDLELSSAQVDELEEADLVLYLGQGFQPAVETVAERRRRASVDLLDAAALDPHFWLDPVRMAGAVDRVAQALAEVAPQRADAFRANAGTYKRELEALHEEFENGLRDCERDTIVTSHAAFHHLAQRYGLVEEPVTRSPEAEADPKRLDELVDFIGEHGVTTVFTEALVSPRLAETLAREAGVGVDVLNPIEGLTRDQLDRGATYTSVMRENLAALRKALGCR